MSKIMFALITLFIDKKDSMIKFDIFMSVIYTEAVRDSI